MSKIVSIFAAAMEKKVDEKKPLKWWLELAIAILSAIAGLLVESKTNVASMLLTF